MTVKELIADLEQYPEDYEVFGTDGHNWYSLDIPRIEEGEKAVVYYDKR